MSAPHTPARQPKGTRTGGQFAATDRAEAAVLLDDETHAPDYMAFMEQGAPRPDDAWRGDCQRCGQALIDDPSGSPGVFVHADENGNPDFDADEDHAPVPEDSVPDLGLAPAGGPFDPETERCDRCDGHFKHAAWCPTLPNPEPDPLAITPQVAYETNRTAAEQALARAGDPDAKPEDQAMGLATASLALESTLSAYADEASTDARAALAKARQDADIDDYTPERVAATADALRKAIAVGDTHIRLFDGRTAAQWREAARESRQRSVDSWERSDTDGFLSQWASDATARKYDACATLAEQGGKAEFPALFDLDGNPVRARLVRTQYGEAWMLLDENNQSTGRFFNESKAKSAARRNAAHAAKGYQTGTVLAPAKVALTDSLQPSPYFYRTDDGFNPDAPIVSLGETHDWN